MNKGPQNQIYQKPPNLSVGDTIGIVSTARKISKEEIAAAKRIIQDLGYKVVFGNHLFGEYHQFSGTAEERAEDLNDMYVNPDIKAILCARGGYGTVQLLPLLKQEYIKKNQKWLIGYSDVTVLHSYLHQQHNIQTLHATMPINFSSYTIDDEPIISMFKVLKGESLIYKLPTNSLNIKGEAEGVLVGGNLSILYSLRGTLADIDTQGKILFIEDLDEYLYHIDRMMMNLKVGDKLKNLKALIVGGMSDMNDNAIPYGQTAKEIILDAVREYNYPVIFDFPAGHIQKNFALPLGQIVRLTVENDNTQLTFL